MAAANYEQAEAQRLKRKRILWACVIGIIALLLIIAGVNNKNTTIDMNDYVTVEFEGTDGEGTASAVFDVDAFTQDYGDQIRFIGSDDSRENLEEPDDGDSDGALFVANCINVEVDPAEDLSNGDTVTLSWDNDDDTASLYFHIAPDCEDQEFEVEGLDDAEDTTGMIFPDADVRLKDADLEGMSKNELKSALYEIYARHGYIFQNEDTQEQFEEYSWYEPTIDADDWDGEEELSSVELANEKLLKAAIKAAKQDSKKRER